MTAAARARATALAPAPAPASVAPTPAPVPAPAQPISAIIPCYNAADWLRPAIESVLAQTRPVQELIVVDDASTDDSCAIASEYPVRLLRMPANRGPAAVRNHALRAAAHDTVAWLDADDYWHPDHCAIVVPLLERHPEAAVAFSALQEVGARTGVWGMPTAAETPRRVLWECFHATIVPTTSAVARRQATLAIGGFREELRIAPDFDFWIRLALAHPFVWTQQVTAVYRRHARQISRAPLAQLESTYRSRALVSDEAEAAGEVALAGEMRARTADLLDDHLREAWWQAEMPRLRLLLDVARVQGFDRPIGRKLRRLSRLPAPCVRGWRALQSRVAGR